MTRASGSNSPRFSPQICARIQLRPVVCRTCRTRWRAPTVPNLAKYGRQSGGRRYGVTAFGGSRSPRKFPQLEQADGNGPRLYRRLYRTATQSGTGGVT